MPDPTTAEADAILSAEKLLGGKVRWTSIAENPTRWTFRVPVIAPRVNDSLVLTGNCSAYRWSFALLANSTPIRRCDCGRKPHRNSNGVILPGNHKHRWHESRRDQDAYIPDDIDFSSVNQRSSIS